MLSIRFSEQALARLSLIFNRSAAAAMQKRNRHFKKVQEYKERFAKLPTEQIVRTLRDDRLTKDAAIAYREILKERGLSDDKPST
jgi:hypothetical protein